MRRILNLTARLWRDEGGMTWLETALFQQLPPHLARMALFKVNTGCREQEVCKPRWDWEIAVPELSLSVFIFSRR